MRTLVVFETKWDGFRLVTEKGRHTVALWSRDGIDVTTNYAVLLPALQKIGGLVRHRRRAMRARRRRALTLPALAERPQQESQATLHVGR